MEALKATQAEVLVDYVMALASLAKGWGTRATEKWEQVADKVISVFSRSNLDAARFALPRLVSCLGKRFEKFLPTITLLLMHCSSAQELADNMACFSLLCFKFPTAFPPVLAARWTDLVNLFGQFNDETVLRNILNLLSALPVDFLALRLHILT